jgi:SAM-dependent methyltransferase
MSPREDAERWNKRYETQTRQTFDRARDFLISNLNMLPASGLALDLAMGLGANAGLLLELGYHVVGVDVSDVAVEMAKKKYPAIMPVIADLTDFDFPPESFDLITNFFYLERSLWRKIPGWLKPGGLLIAEILTLEMLSLHPETQSQFLLNPGELAVAFPSLEILSYAEGWYGDEHRRATARLVARKPEIPT